MIYARRRSRFRKLVRNDIALFHAPTLGLACEFLTVRSVRDVDTLTHTTDISGQW